MAVSLLYVRGRFFVVGVARRIDVFIDVVLVNSQIVHIKRYTYPMKTAVRLGTIAHLKACVVRFYCIRKPGMREKVSKPHPLSHTWLPYITPNGVRLARETLIKSYSIYQTQNFLSEPKKSWILNTLPNGAIHYNMSFRW